MAMGKISAKPVSKQVAKKAQPVVIVKPKKKKNSNRQPIGNSIVFPMKKKVTFTSSGTNRITLGGVGALEYFTIRMNGPQDPLYGVGGPSCEWYDTLLGADVSKKPYRAYRVLAARLKAQFVSEGAANTSLLECALHAREEAELPLVSSSDFYSADHTTHTILGSGYSGNGVKVLRMSLNKSQLTKFFGVKDIEDDADTASLYNTVPQKEILCDIMIQPFVSTSTAVVDIRWTIEYDCQLFDLNQYQ